MAARGAAALQTHPVPRDPAAETEQPQLIRLSYVQPHGLGEIDNEIIHRRKIYIC